MKFRIAAALAAVSIILAGCAAPQPPVPLSPKAFETKTSRIGVAMAPLPKVDTSFPGAGCLLCIATASMANSKLTDYTRTLSYEDVPSLKNAMAELLRKKGGDVVVIDENVDVDSLPDYSASGPGIAKQDYSSLKNKYKLDKLLMIRVSYLGIVRNYSSYFPTSDPMARFAGTGALINLSNNSYEWYLPVEISKIAEGAWDEPPKFPGLTNAYFQAIENGKDSFLKPFSD